MTMKNGMRINKDTTSSDLKLHQKLSSDELWTMLLVMNRFFLSTWLSCVSAKSTFHFIKCRFLSSWFLFSEDAEEDRDESRRRKVSRGEFLKLNYIISTVDTQWTAQTAFLFGMMAQVMRRTIICRANKRFPFKLANKRVIEWTSVSQTSYCFIAIKIKMFGCPFTGKSQSVKVPRSSFKRFSHFITKAKQSVLCDQEKWKITRQHNNELWVPALCSALCSVYS